MIKAIPHLFQAGCELPPALPRPQPDTNGQDRLHIY